MKTYSVHISPALDMTILARNRAQAAMLAIRQHDRTEKGQKKRNGQREKLGWPLVVTVIRID